MRLPKGAIKNPLTAYGIVLAIQTMAEMFDERPKDQAVEWAVKVGWLLPHPRNRGEVVLTPAGQYAVHLFYKTVDEGRQIGREEVDLGGAA